MSSNPLLPARPTRSTKLPESYAALALLVGVILVVKLLFLHYVISADPNFYNYADAPGFTSIADTWLRTGEYRRHLDSAIPETERPPGWPAMILLFQAAYGEAGRIVLTFFQQVAYHALLLLACLVLARRYGGRSALYFGLVLSLHLFAFHYVGGLYSDGQFMIATFGSFFLMLMWLEGEMRPAWVVLVAIAALWVAELTRAEFLYLPIALGMVVFGFLLPGFRRGSRSGALPALSVYAAAALVPILAWSWRNYTVTGRFQFTSSLGDIASAVLLRGGTETAEGEMSATGLVADTARVGSALLSRVGETFFNLVVTPGRWYLIKYAEALGFADHVVVDPWKTGIIGRFNELELVYIAYNSLLTATILGFFALGLYRVLCGSARLLSPAGIALALLPIVYLSAVQFAWGGAPRYFVPMLPFFALFGALFFAERPADDPSGRFV